MSKLETSRVVSARVADRIGRALSEAGLVGQAWYAVHSEDLDQVSTDAVLETAWAFRPQFLADHTGLPVELFDALVANNRCEDNNEVVLTLLRKVGPGIEAFVRDAIAADGVGHFLSPYDGEEHEITVGKTRWHLFRRE